MSARTGVMIFFVAFVTRVMIGWRSFLSPAAAHTNDSFAYRQLADELLHGRFPSLFRTPGYPLFLALTGGFPESTLVSTLLVQTVLDSVTAVMVAAIAWRLWSDPWAARLAGLLYAICPVSATLCSMVMTETLFIFLTVVALFLGLCRQTSLSLIAQALCWSAATLTRPSGVLLPFIVGFFLIIRQAKPDKFRQAIVLGLYTLIISMWVGFNYRRVGTPILCSLPAVTVYMYELPAVRMADQLSWLDYTRLWIFNPREAERIRQVYEKDFVQEVFARSGAIPPDLWTTIDDPYAIHRLKAEADLQLQDRLPARIGIHLVGALQILRPISPSAPGGVIATIVDGLRLLLLPVALMVLARRQQWWLLSLFAVWFSYTLFLPGVNGIWRFRSMAEPILSLVLAAGATGLFIQGRVYRSLRNEIDSGLRKQEGQQ
ncbi:MAG TPA: hypothetical protein VNO70_23965 [Blastocatellia bacterium]|nr:hypothetical protein [Blastocatellia bacterium]